MHPNCKLRSLVCGGRNPDSHGQRAMIKRWICIMLASFVLHRYSRVSAFVRSFRIVVPSLQRKQLLLPRSRFASTKTIDVDDESPTLTSKPKRVTKKRLPSISDVGEDSAREELINLNSELRRHSVLYFEKNEPEISDAAYDKLVNRAEALVGKFRHLVDLVPTLNTVGMGKSSKFAPFKHSSPMLSLSKAFTTDELTSFMDKIDKTLLQTEEPSANVEYVLEPKIDGLSLGVIYEHDPSTGKWCVTGAGTRGDGDVGEDVTANVRKYMKQAIPESLNAAQVLPLLPAHTTQTFDPHGVKLEIRGEVFIPRSGFNLLNQQRAQDSDGAVKDPQLATARNAAAGALRKIKETNTGREGSAQDHLQFFAYSLFYHKSSISTSSAKKKTKSTQEDMEVTDVHKRQSDTLTSLAKLGFSVAQPWALATHREAVLATCSAWESLRSGWDFDADGAVLKLNHISHQKTLGTTSRCPKWAVAYKFAADQVLTTLKSIDVRVGRTGVLTPVACLEPVKVGGVVVESATLHNENEINRLNLKVGDKVWLKRAGDVIPKILGVDRTTTSASEDKETMRSAYRLPTSCPDCGSATERVYSDKGKNVEGDDLSPVSVRCTGGAAVCPAQAIEQISHFASRDAAAIDGLGRSRVEDLFEGGLVSSVLDLYELRNKDLTYTTPAVPTSDTATDVGSGDASPLDDASLRGRKGWGDKSVNHLLAAVDKARLLEDHRFLFGLGVRHIGVENARLIVDAFKGFPQLWEYLRTEADKLKAAGLQFNMLPRQRATRAKSKATASTPAPADSSSSPTLYVHECAARLQGIAGLGPKAVEALLEFATHPRSVSQVQGLLGHVSFTSQTFAAPAAGDRAAGVSDSSSRDRSALNKSPDLTDPAPRATQTLPLQGRVAVFTGKLEIGSRAEAQSMFQALGGEVRPSINKSVNLLIQASDARNSSKHKKAIEMGIEVWSEEEWSAFVKCSGSS